VQDGGEHGHKPPRRDGVWRRRGQPCQPSWRELWRELARGIPEDNEAAEAEPGNLG
jgi:hypothetical protein